MKRENLRHERLTSDLGGRVVGQKPVEQTEEEKKKAKEFVEAVLNWTPKD